VAPRGAAFPLVVAIEEECETFDDDTVVAMFACAFLRYAERIVIGPVCASAFIPLGTVRRSKCLPRTA
jgi:hypothetical protein